MNNNRGFTLIEMLIVVVIIGILVSIVLPKVTGYSERARISACEKNVQTLNQQIELIIFKEGLSVGSVSGYFPTGSITADFSGLPLVDLVDFFPQGGAFCPYNNGLEARYYIFNSNVKTDQVGANHDH